MTSATLLNKKLHKLSISDHNHHNNHQGFDDASTLINSTNDAEDEELESLISQQYIKFLNYEELQSKYGINKYYPMYIHNFDISTPILKDLIIDKPIYQDANKHVKKQQQQRLKKKQLRKEKKSELKQLRKDQRQELQQLRHDHRVESKEIKQKYRGCLMKPGFSSQSIQNDNYNNNNNGPEEEEESTRSFNPYESKTNYQTASTLNHIDNPTSTTIPPKYHHHNDSTGETTQDEDDEEDLLKDVTMKDGGLYFKDPFSSMAMNNNSSLNNNNGDGQYTIPTTANNTIDTINDAQIRHNSYINNNSNYTHLQQDSKKRSNSITNKFLSFMKGGSGGSSQSMSQSTSLNNQIPPPATGQSQGQPYHEFDEEVVHPLKKSFSYDQTKSNMTQSRHNIKHKLNKFKLNPDPRNRSSDFIGMY